MNDVDSLMELRNLIDEWVIEHAPGDFVHGVAAGLASHCEALIGTELGIGPCGRSTLPAAGRA